MRNLVVLILFLFLSLSCGDDAADSATTVEGTWELVRATRNNTETEMLDGLTFHFFENGTLETNLLGNTSPGTYEWTEDQIITAGIKLPLTYRIQDLTDSTLHLRSSYQGFQFDFMMARGVPQVRIE